MRRESRRTGVAGARNDSGAAAVEFAFIFVLVLLPVLVGIVEFGRVYNVQLGLTAAAREGVRVMALDNDPAATRAAVRAAGPSVTPALSNSSIVIVVRSAAGNVLSPSTCTADATVTVTVTYQVVFLTGLLGNGPKLTGKGVMRCNG